MCGGFPGRSMFLPLCPNPPDKRNRSGGVDKARAQSANCVEEVAMVDG